MTCVLVLGVHRSGTSAVAGVLHHLGVDMRQSLRGGHSSNEAGHFEDEEFLRLNDAVVGNWKDPITWAITDIGLEKYKNLIQVRKDILYWGIKDPRLCVTARWFLPMLGDVKIISVKRNFDDSVCSLMLRDGFTRDEAVFVQNIYQYGKSNLLKIADCPVLEVCYEDLVGDPVNEIRKITKFVYGNYLAGDAEEAVKFIRSNKNLFHWKYREKGELVSIVIPAVGNPDLTAKCVESIRRNSHFPYEIVIVDNGSSPEDTQFLRDLGSDQYLYSEELLGFPRACNAGIDAADGDYVVILNNDTEIKTDHWLEILIESLERSGSAIVSPVLDFVGNPAQDVENSKGKLVQTNNLMFVCVLMRRSLIDEIGVLDERFGIGNSEDLDFCHRATRNGGRLLVNGEVEVYHEGHSTFKNLMEPDQFGELLAKNQGILVRKYQPKDFGRIAIATPVRGFRGQFFRDWTRLLIRGLRPGDTVIEPAIDMLVHDARNLLFFNFLNQNKDTLLFIDSDSAFEADVLERLRTDARTFEYDIVQALVSTRHLPLEPIVFKKVEDPPHFVRAGASDFEIGEVIEVPRCGMAFTLIRRWVIEATAVRGWERSRWFEFARDTGEDVVFTAKAQKAGAKMCVNTAIEIGHIGSHVYRWSERGEMGEKGISPL